MAISFSQRQYWRFLYKVPPSTFYTLAPESAVCVCHPLYLRVPPLTSVTKSFECRGQRDLQSWPLPTKLHTGRSGKRTCAVIPLHSSLLCFDAMVVHVSPPKPFLPPQPRRRFVRCCRESADAHKPRVQTSAIDRTPHLTVEAFLSLGN